jgi:two-component system chemotaxis response regulator CheY
MALNCAEALTLVVTQTMNAIFPVHARLKEKHKKFWREASFEVSGIVGVTGPIRGGLALSFPMKLARRLTASMLQESDPESCCEKDVCDCVGEVANIVAGNLLPHLSDDNSCNEKLSMSLPSVVVGTHEVVWNSKDMPCESLLFDSELGMFAAEMSFRSAVASDTAKQLCRIMVVDDSRVMRRMLEKALRDAGFAECEILQAEDGLAAVEELRRISYKVDAVFCDLCMPNLDGLGFIDVLGSDGVLGRVPVIICTGDVREARGREALTRGARKLIAKPFTLQDVAESLKDVLAKPTSA